MKRSLSLLFSLALLALTLTACEAQETPEPVSNDPVEEPTAQAPAVAGTKLDLNTASGDDFRTIPGMTDRMVHEFEEYRPYVSIQQFRREMAKYVADSTITRYERYVFVPVNVNESDAATLQQIPGLDATEAEALIAGRPYASNDAFLEALAQYVTEEERATAQTYLTAQ